jgi:thiosulfate/3-mercaptopyruvate sulfurtransferase
VSAPFADNIDAEGKFKTPADLRTRFASLLGDADPTRVVFYFGSGVTAAFNILAFLHAGKAMPRLYAGSWSDWITDPRRPVATGE